MAHLQKIEREFWIDNLKAIGMFFVVLGHLSISESLRNYIFSFHIPIFFFASGYLFNSVKHNDFWKFFKNRFSRIIVPYFFFSFLTYLFWVFFTCRFFEDPEFKGRFLQNFMGIFYSVGTNEWLRYNIPIWFLTCLFLTEIAFFVFHKYIKNKSYLAIFLLILSVIGYIASLTVSVRLPWNINAIPMVLIFYFVGFNYKKEISEFIKKIDFKYLLIAVGLIILSIILGVANQRVDVNHNLYGNYAVFFIATFAGIFCYAVLGKIIGRNGILKAISYHSLAIMCLHSPVGYLLLYFQYFIFKIPLHYGDDKLWFAVIFALLQLTVCVGLAMLFKKLVPKLSGYIK